MFSSGNFKYESFKTSFCNFNWRFFIYIQKICTRISKEIIRWNSKNIIFSEKSFKEFMSWWAVDFFIYFWEIEKKTSIENKNSLFLKFCMYKITSSLTKMIKKESFFLWQPTWASLWNDWIWGKWFWILLVHKNIQNFQKVMSDAYSYVILKIFFPYRYIFFTF